MQVKNILVPIDFSKCSKSALKVAIQIAEKEQAKIHMVNAVQVQTPHPDLTGGNLIDSIVSDYEAQVRVSYFELKKEVVELKNVPHETERFLAYFSDAILTAIDLREIDLVVMGTRADHGTLDNLVGTHATDVMESAQVPVLIIPEGQESFKPTKIGFATDLLKMKPSKVDLSPLKWLAGLYDAEVLAFHVADDIGEMTTEDQKQISFIATALEGKASVRTIEAESLTQGIREFTKIHKLDSLVMIPRKHSFLEKLFKKSVSKSITLDPDVPVLTFRN